MEFWCNCTERGKAEVLEEQPDPPPLFLSANATWALLEMNAGLRFEKLAASSLSYDKTVLKFPMWFLDWLGLHWLGFSVISNFIFQVWTLSAGVHSISKTNSKPDNSYIETAGRRNTRKKEGKKSSLYFKFLQCITSGNCTFVRYQKYVRWHKL